MMKTANIVEGFRLDGSGVGWANGYLVYPSGPTYVNGKFGKCLSFDGVDDTCAVANGVRNALCGKSAISLTAWINPSASVVNGCILVTQAQADGYVGASIEVLTNSKFQIRARSTSGEALATYNYTYSFNNGTWYHLAASIDYEGDNIKGWINGSKVIDTAHNFSQSTYNFSSGTIYSYIGTISSANRFKGLIDECSFWKGTLSDSNVKRIMCGLHPF